MSFGSLILRVRQKFGHGLRVAYWRNTARPWILRTRPVRNTTEKVCEIHVMTCREDWLNLLSALKSFYWASGRHYALCIHDDGSLEPDHIETLKIHFPDARIIDRHCGDQRIRALWRPTRDVFSFGWRIDWRRRFLIFPSTLNLTA